MPTPSTLGNESPRSFSGLYKRARLWPFSTKMHLWMQQAFVYSLYWCGAFWWAKRSLRKNGSVVVLTFHRVLRDSAFENSTVLRGVVVRENTFRELAGHISKYYEAIKIDETLPGNPSDRLRRSLNQQSSDTPTICQDPQLECSSASTKRDALTSFENEWKAISRPLLMP